MPIDGKVNSGVFIDVLREPARKAALDLLAGGKKDEDVPIVGGFSVARKEAVVDGDIVYQFTVEGEWFIIFEPMG